MLFAFGPNSAGFFNMFASKAQDHANAWYEDWSDDRFIDAYVCGMPMKRTIQVLPDGT